MSPPFWVIEAAANFWKDAGGEEGFPRELRRPIARSKTTSISVVLLPRLRIAGVDAWLARSSVDCPLTTPDRPLRACLVARFGVGFIFVDGADPPDEQRFSLAHELAHFLNDYWYPRREVLRALGPSALEVLDGERPASRLEQVHGVLAHLPLGAYSHLMERTAAGEAASASIASAESAADRLAFELLAPSDRVMRDSERLPLSQQRPVVTQRLQCDFGLPAPAALRYARLLVPDQTSHPILQLLGAADGDRPISGAGGE